MLISCPYGTGVRLRNINAFPRLRPLRGNRILRATSKRNYERSYSCCCYRRRRPNRLFPPVPHRLGRDVRAAPALDSAPDRDRAGDARAAGPGDGAGGRRFPAAQRRGGHVQPGGRVSRGELGAAGRQRAAQARHGAQGLAGRQRQDLCRAGPGAAEARRGGRAHPGGGQSLQHQLPDRHAQRAGNSARPVLRHDAPGRESRQGAARQEGRPGCDGGHQCLHLGQPFLDAVSGFLQRQDQRPAGDASDHGRGLAERRVHHLGPAARRGDSQGARGLQRRQRGRRHRGHGAVPWSGRSTPAIGTASASAPMAATGSSRA